MIDIESERAKFQSWYLENAGDPFCLLPDLFLRMHGSPDEYSHLGPRVAFKAWLAAKADSAVVAEEHPPCTVCHCAERAQKMLGDPRIGVHFPPRDFSKCAVCGSKLVLHFWDRPGGPPGNGYGLCEVCTAALNRGG